MFICFFATFITDFSDVGSVLNAVFIFLLFAHLFCFFPRFLSIKNPVQF